MFFNFKHYSNILFIILFIILIGCKLQEPTKSHGIVFLKNRAEKLNINSSNKNDVIRIFGEPHSKSFYNENEWLYFERILTKGEFLKLGQNVLKTNNILILNFDKYGVLKEKLLLDKNSKNKISFSKDETTNDISQKSFVEKFFQSIKTKMYKK